MHINMNIPYISPVLAVAYFFICFKLSLRAEISPVESSPATSRADSAAGGPVRSLTGVPSASATSSRRRNQSDTTADQDDAHPISRPPTSPAPKPKAVSRCIKVSNRSSYASRVW
jgi:hypothetical protein